MVRECKGGIQTHVIGWILTLGLLLVLPAAGEATSYTFTKIAETSSGSTGFAFFDSASINDGGTVAFSAVLNSRESGIFTGDGTVVSSVADTTGPLSALGPPSISNGGMVAFWVRFDTGDIGISRGDGTTLTSIADSRGPFNFFGVFPSINNGGTVAFWARFDAGGTGILTSDGSTLTTVVATSDPFSSYNDPSLNDGATVAFKFRERVASAILNHIMTSDGTTHTHVADSSGPYNAFGDPSLNDGGQVAFQASLDAGGSQILRSDGITLTSIADTSGPFNFLHAVSLNDSGQVAWLASLDAGGTGIFTGPDPIADKVITVGDPLAASTVTQLGFGREGLNAAGQVAFIARLADGSQGVYRADPVVAGKQDVAQDVTIVITPGGNPNSINLRSRGTVPVAVLSTAAFNATRVDPMTVTLAESPVKLKRNGTPMAAFEDVDGDGRLDLVVHVDTQALRLDAADTEAVLVGRTLDGTDITGTDVVRIIP